MSKNPSISQFSLYGMAMAIVVLCCQCQKTPRDIITIVEGKLLTLGTNEIVPDGPHMILMDNRDTIFTDENGYFRWENIEEGGDLPEYGFNPSFIGEYPAGYVDEYNYQRTSSSIGNWPKTKSGDHVVNNVYLARRAWVKWHIVNINPTPFDRITLRGGGFQWQSDTTLFGAQDVILTVSGIGNGHNIIGYWTYSEGVSTPLQIDSVFAGDHDTVYHKIEY